MHASMACSLKLKAAVQHARAASTRTGGLFPLRGRGSSVRALHSDVPVSFMDSVVHHVNVMATLAEDAAVNAAAAGAASDAVSSAAETTVRSQSSPFDFLAVIFENVLEALDGVLEKAHVPYSYGFAIILLTVLVKAATFPLSKKQVESTVAIQALQPRVKELQAKYVNDQETIQLETAKLYREAGVNPLAGCLPTLATIPVFIGLYRALTLAAEDNLLEQPFFWIPSLSGPSSLAQQAAGTGLSWLFPFENGAPPIGWGPATAYLVLPVLLVVSQFVSQKLISPASQDPSQKQTQIILQFLPLLIGWFSLNVPAGLTLYWFVNNLLSTGQQVYLKSTAKVNIPGSGSGAAAATAIPSTSTPYISPKEEKVKKTTGKETGSRRRQSDVVVDVEAEVVSSREPTANGQPKQQSGSRGKGDKFRARKAREAAARAASVATPAGTSASPPPPPSPPPSSSASPVPAGNTASSSGTETTTANKD